MPAHVPQTTRNILILGSTGVIGTYITRALVDAREHFERICILTSEKTLVEKLQDIAALEACGVEIFTGRLEKESAVKKAYEGTCYAATSTGYLDGVVGGWRLGGLSRALQVTRHLHVVAYDTDT